MSGHSAGPSCRNAHPSPAEAAEVDRNFARGLAVTTAGRVFRDCFTDAA